MTIEQAALSQLETAIELWFHDKDPVSIHTLAAAAEGMFTTIARERGIKLSDSAMEYLASTPKKFQDFMRKPQNFFKHGNPKLKWDFYHPEHGEVFLESAVGSCLQLFPDNPPLLVLLFALWCGSNNPTSELISDTNKPIMLKCAELNQITGGNKAKFFDTIFPALQLAAHEESSVSNADSD